MTPLCRYHAESDCARCARLLVGEILQYHFYVVALIRSPLTKQTKLLAPPDPRQHLKYNVAYTKADVIASHPLDDGSVVELSGKRYSPTSDYIFFQVCVVNDARCTIDYKGYFYKESSARNVFTSIVSGTYVAKATYAARHD